MFGTDVNLDVILNPDKGDVQIFQNLEVVEDGTVTDPNLQIGLTDAKADQDPDAEIGDEHTREIFFADFGRRAILTLRQTLQSKILDLQKEAIYDKFKELEGELVTGEVYQTWSRETLLLDDDKTSFCFPKASRSPATSSARVRQCVPWCRMSTTRTTIPRSPSAARARISFAACLSWRCPRSTTDSSAYVRWHASRVSAPRLPWRATTSA